MYNEQRGPDGVEKLPELHILQVTFYLCSTPKGEDEDLLLFMVPKVHQTAALNGYHRDAGHQGRDRTLSLLQEHFW